MAGLDVDSTGCVRSWVPARNACYHGVPNARVIAAVKAAEWLSGAEGPKTAGQMREALEISEAVVDPQDWWDLEAITPSYTIDIRWSNSGAEGRYDVICMRHQHAAEKWVGALSPRPPR